MYVLIACPTRIHSARTRSAPMYLRNFYVRTYVYIKECCEKLQKRRVQERLVTVWHLEVTIVAVEDCEAEGRERASERARQRERAGGDQRR